MPDYDALRVTADRLIGSFGKEMLVTLVQFEAGAYDPVNDDQAIIEAPYPIKGVLLNKPPDLAADTSFTYADTVTVAMPALGLPVRPKPGDAVDIPTLGRWAVKDVKATRPDTVPIVFMLTCKRGAA